MRSSVNLLVRGAKQKRAKLLLGVILILCFIILTSIYFKQKSDDISLTAGTIRDSENQTGNVSITNQTIEETEKQTSPKISITSGTIKETEKLEEKQILGNLEITLISALEDTYGTFELINKTYEKVWKKYYKVYIKVFNPSSNEKESFSIIELEDNFGDKYELDNNILLNLGGSDFKEFGRNMTIYPRVIREGYLVFPEIDSDAKELKLIFETEKGGKAVFEFGK